MKRIIKILLLLITLVIIQCVNSIKLLNNNNNYIKSVSCILSLTLLNFNHVYALDNKLVNLDNNKIASIVTDDIIKRQALITADFTRDIYKENCKFQDEIDTYEINQYIKGTKALFNAEKSHVDLIGNVEADKDFVKFAFSEKLTFNVPFSPAVTLTGKVKLTRDPENGLISYSREYWDQSVNKVLSTVKFQ